MGMDIQYLPGTGHRSCLQIENLLRLAAHELPARDYRVVEPMLDASNARDLPVRFPAKQAAAMRDVLRTLADKLDRRGGAPDWADTARAFATAADTAARSDRPWTWN